MSVLEAEERLNDDEVPQRIPMSRAEYDAMPEGWPLFEWVDGEAIELIAPIPKHGDAVFRVGYLIQLSCPQLRVIVDAALDMPNSVRIPDLLIVADYPLEAVGITEPALVAVEVLSPSNWREDLNRKPKEGSTS